MFFSDVVTFELTDCEMQGQKKTHARPGPMKALGMGGKHAKKKPTRTRANPKGGPKKTNLHIFWVPA